MNTVAAIEQVLSRGSKSSTYKLAVLRALVDFVIEHPGREPVNGFHFVPVVELARRALGYYWSLALSGIPQGRPAPKIPEIVSALSRSGLAVPGLELQDPRSGLALVTLVEEAEQVPPAVLDAVLEVRKVLLDQPLQHLPNVGDKRMDIFSLLTVPGAAGGGPRPDASYDEHRRAAPSKSELKAGAWTEVLERERTLLTLSARSYEEIAEVRFWVRDAILLRWARECERFGATQVPASAFELGIPERDPVVVGELKRIYSTLGHGTRCLYTGRELPAVWALDHVLPWSRFPVNLFWNLVPAHPEANSAKSDRLPVFSEELRRRYLNLLEAGLASHSPLVEKDVSATFRRYFQRGRPAEAGVSEVPRDLWSVMETSHARLLEAGIDVWEATTVA